MAWQCLGTPGTECVYDQQGTIVYWRSCDDVRNACGGYCRQGGPATRPECNLDPAIDTLDAGKVDPSGDASDADAG